MADENGVDSTLIYGILIVIIVPEMAFHRGVSEAGLAAPRSQIQALFEQNMICNRTQSHILHLLDART